MYQCGLILTYNPDELASGEESGNFSKSKKSSSCKNLFSAYLISIKISNCQIVQSSWRQAGRTRKVRFRKSRALKSPFFKMQDFVTAEFFQVP